MEDRRFPLNARHAAILCAGLACAALAYSASLAAPLATAKGSDSTMLKPLPQAPRKRSDDPYRVRVRLVKNQPGVQLAPPVTEGSIVPPPVPEPIVTEVIEPELIEPAVDEPAIEEPAVVEPAVTDPAVTEPQVSEQNPTEPEPSEPSLRREQVPPVEPIAPQPTQPELLPETDAAPSPTPRETQDQPTDMVEGIEIGIEPIGEIDVVDHVNSGSVELPPDHASTAFDARPLHWSADQIAWPKPATPSLSGEFCHRPLYFEEANLERFGNRCGFAQPILSAARFYATIPAMPYLAAADPPNVCRYEKYPYQAGRSAPRVRELPPLSIKGGVVEAGTAVGLILLVP